MPANVFDGGAPSYRVLVNDLGQHSLWPGDVPVPPGWTGVHGPAAHDDCLAWVDRHWTDLRPVAAR